MKTTTVLTFFVVVLSLVYNNVSAQSNPQPCPDCGVKAANPQPNARPKREIIGALGALARHAGQRYGFEGYNDLSGEQLKNIGRRAAHDARRKFGRGIRNRFPEIGEHYDRIVRGGRRIRDFGDRIAEKARRYADEERENSRRSGSGRSGRKSGSGKSGRRSGRGKSGRKSRGGRSGRKSGGGRSGRKSGGGRSGRKSGGGRSGRGSGRKGGKGKSHS